MQAKSNDTIERNGRRASGALQSSTNSAIQPDQIGHNLKPKTKETLKHDGQHQDNTYDRTVQRAFTEMASKRHRPTSDKELQACSGGAGQSDQGKPDVTVNAGETLQMGEGNQKFGTVTVNKGGTLEIG